MTPRRRDEEPEDDDFDAQFDDDVFAAPEPVDDDDDESERKPRARARAREGARARGDAGAPKRSSRSGRGSGRSGSGRSTSRSRRALRIGGVALLAVALIAFVISFVSGLRGGPDERITGDAEHGGEELDRMGPRVRVEVLNAGGVAGLARRATEHLRDRGFDVVAFGNAGVSDNERTVVLARTSDVDDARDVAAALGVDTVAVEPDPQLYLDVTVLLGRDWPPAAAEPVEDPGFFGWFRSLF